MSRLPDFFSGQPAVVDQNLRLKSFTISYHTATWPFPDDFKIAFAELFYRHFFQVCTDAKLRLGSIEFTPPSQAIIHNEMQMRAGKQARTGWFAVSYAEPGKEFAITLDETVFQIRVARLNLSSVVSLTNEVFSRVVGILFSKELATPFQLEQRAHSMSVLFENVFRIGTDKVQGTPCPNWRIMAGALSLEKKNTATTSRAINNAFHSLEADTFVRMDFTQHATRKINGHTYNTIVSAQAPFNESNTILQVDSVLKMEEPWGFNITAATDLEVALVDFYRDIILKRFLDNLLCTVNYLPES